MRSLVFLLALSSLTVAQEGPPPTETKAVVDELHGVKIEDPYRWLEGSDAPEIEGTNAELEAKVAEWTEAQNSYTRRVLDSLPEREQLEARLRELMSVGSVGSPRMAGNRYFYSRQEGDQAQSIVMMREGPTGEPRVLLDPNALDPEGLTTVSWFVPNPSGELLAFGMYRGGDENSTLYVLEVDSGQWLADEIPGKVGGVNWMPDGRSFFYRRLADLSNPYSGRIQYHELGRHPRQDPILFEQYKEGPLATTYGPWASISDDGRWMQLGYATGTRENDLWVIDLDRWFRTGDFIKTDIIVGKKAQSAGELLGDTLYLQTNFDAPNGRVVAVDLHKPAIESWRTIVPESEGAVLQGFSLARGILVAQYLEKASSRIRLFDLDGQNDRPLELPGIGRAGLSTSPDRTEAFLSFSSYNVPSSIYRVDLSSGERTLWERVSVPVDPELVTVKQVWYPSKDGTQISMFLVHRKDLRLDGKNPTILYGYGGFNVSMQPGFSATMFPWYERGGIYAVANLRGGGEYGREWHEAGRLARKQNVFDDFIAAGEWLIEQGYTSAQHLGVAGGSNGGLLTGAVVTQRPDLFTAAISAVPLLDMIRYQDFLMARYWIPEYGSSEDPEQFKTLMAYSPYQNVMAGVAYPAVLFTAGENDARVHPLHARKMTARMQAATKSDPSKEPILLWVDRDAGHGAGKSLDQRIQDVADQRIFMMWQTGMLSVQ
ncbi:MAG: prolyl oligopeptidase family serine peptidase [Planctomycetota bacterium]